MSTGAQLLVSFADRSLLPESGFTMYQVLSRYVLNELLQVSMWGRPCRTKCRQVIVRTFSFMYLSHSCASDTFSSQKNAVSVSVLLEIP